MLVARRSRTTVWRWAVVWGVLALAIAPAVPLLAAALGEPAKNPLWTEAFAAAVANSLSLAVAVGVVSLAVGFPLGLLSALYRFPGRVPLIAVQALPLLLPSFLLAIGWRNLLGGGRLPAFLLAAFPSVGHLNASPNGRPGAVLVLGLQAVPLVLFATWAACRNLTASQIDAARLAGGEKTVWTLSAGSCAPVAVVTALLAGILSLTDPGAPLIFRCHSAAMEIRTSFASLGDKVLAARQCLVMAGLALSLAVPVLLVGLRRLAAAVLAQQTRPALPYPHPALGLLTQISLIGVIALGTGAAALGLCLPAIRDPMFGRAAQKVWATAGPSLVYTTGAGALAVVLALAVALAAGRDWRLRSAALGLFLMLLALPPALGAIGVVHLAAKAPPALDWLTRSQLTVALVLGLRFLPVAVVAMMRAVGSLSPSWTDAAEVHGVSRLWLLLRVIVPVLMPAILVSVLLVVVLAAADVTTVHLLHPPGRQSLPLAIFTVMANSPEGLVASLCLLYLLGVLGLMALALLLYLLGVLKLAAVAWQLPRWLRRRTSWEP